MAAEDPRTRPQTPGPLMDASRVRSGISQALHTESWYSEIITPEVAACLIGISSDIVTNPHMSILFHHTADGFTVAAGTTKQTAMEAFRGWSRNPDKRSRNTFARDAYMSLYRVFQAAAESAGDTAFPDVAEFFVTALAEDDEAWIHFLERIKAHGDIAGDEDAGIISEKMHGLWQKIPQGMQRELASYNPKHLFGG